MDLNEEFIVRCLRLEKSMRDNFIETSKLELEFNDMSTYSKEYRDAHATELKNARDAKLATIVKKYDSDFDQCERVWYGKNYDSGHASIVALKKKFGIE